MEPAESPESTPGQRLGDLPAVERPSTSFFLQLFVLPALIVFGIIIVWYLFGKLAGSDRSIEDYVAIIKSDRGDRWKAALDLSHLLNEQSTYTKDQSLAQLLADELQKGLSPSSGGQGDAQYVEYLAGSLGSFQLTTGVPALRLAIQSNQPLGVRKAALLSLAKLADRLGDLKDQGVRADAEKTLKDEDSYMRSLSALLLGKMKDPAAEPALQAALSDPDATVRYNAACALAALGSDAGVGVLTEMLDPAGLAKRFTFEDDNHQTHVDQPLVAATTVQAIHSLEQLIDAKPSAKLDGVRSAAEALANDENAMIRSEAKGLLIKLSTTQKGSQP